MQEFERRLHFGEQCKDYFKWCFKLWLCSEQQGLNGGEPRLIMQPAWPSLIRIISAHCFTAATGPLNAKCLCRPIACCLPLWPVTFQQWLLNGNYSKHFLSNRGTGFTRLLKIHNKICHFMTRMGIVHFKAVPLGLPCRRGPFEVILSPRNIFWWRRVEVDSYYSFHKSSFVFKNLIFDISF